MRKTEGEKQAIGELKEAMKSKAEVGTRKGEKRRGETTRRPATFCDERRDFILLDTGNKMWCCHGFTLPGWK